MVQRWRCRHCGFLAWSDRPQRLAEKTRSHLFDHHKTQIAKRDFRYNWQCPYCEANSMTHDREQAIEEFKDHLYDHGADSVKQDTHVAEEIDWQGKILVNAPSESEGAETVREHLLSPGDLLVIVTKHPASRIEHIAELFEDWPAQTTIITTRRQPLPENLGIDFTGIDIELVELDQRLGPDELGETISRVIDAHEQPGQKLSFEFDIISEIIQSFDLKTSIEFIRQISARLDSADALAHFYMRPYPNSGTIFNVFEEQFDLELAATESLIHTAD